MQFEKMIITLWIRWKKHVKSNFTVDPENAEGVQDVGGNTSDNYTSVEMPFNSLMAEFFEDSDINDLIQRMLAHIKTKTRKPSSV